MPQMLCFTVVALSRRRKCYVLRGALSLWLSNAMFYVVRYRLGSQTLCFTVVAPAWRSKCYVLRWSRSRGVENAMFYVVRYRFGSQIPGCLLRDKKGL